MNQPPWSHQTCEAHLSKEDLEDLQINTDSDNIGGHTLTPIKDNARSLSRARVRTRGLRHKTNAVRRPVPS